MLKSELDELGKGDELTAEAIEMLMNDQSFFEQVFNGPRLIYHWSEFHQEWCADQTIEFQPSSIEPGQRAIRKASQ